MKKTKWTVLVLLAVVCAASAYEMRTWQDTDGTEFQGRFYREMFGKLTIETEEGEKKVLDISDLSELDKKYVRVMVPPLIEVEVRTKTTPIPDRPQFYPRPEKNLNHVVSAQIIKKSQRPFTSRLEAELFLVAEEFEADNYILLSYTKGDFLLLEEKDDQYVFKSKTTRTSSYEDLLTKNTRGEVYMGYLLVISSMQGEVIALHSSLPKWMQQPELIDNLRELAVRGAPSVRSRHFDKTGKKTPPPRPRYVQPWAR